VEDLSAGPLYRYQESLPRLPVPTLSSTAAKYLETVRPHLTPSDFSNTEAAVSTFLRSPLAPELQKRLEARAADPGVKNWLPGLWEESRDIGYTGARRVFR